MDFGEVEDPITDAERMKVAGSCVKDLGLEKLPALVDRMDDAANRAYGAFPDRLYLVGRDGKIAYAGGPGPFGFKPDQLGAAIVKELAKKKPAGKEL